MVLSRTEESDLSHYKHSASRRIRTHHQRYWGDSAVHIHTELNPHFCTYLWCEEIPTPTYCTRYRIHCSTHRNVGYTVFQWFKFKGWSFSRCDLFFFSVKQGSAASDQIGLYIITLWGDFILSATTEHGHLYSFIYTLSCKIAKLAINIKANLDF